MKLELNFLCVKFRRVQSAIQNLQFKVRIAPLDDPIEKGHFHNLVEHSVDKRSCAGAMN